MKINSNQIAFVIFLFLVISMIFFSISSHIKKGEERRETNKIFRDSVFSDLSLFGEIVEVRITKASGRRIRIRCIEIIDSSLDSLYVFNKKVNTAFKIDKNLAVMSGGARDYENLQYVDINYKNPGMLTLYDKNLDEIRQGPVNTAFSAAFVTEDDMKICDDFLKN
jgi:hypothetical protein